MNQTLKRGQRITYHIMVWTVYAGLNYLLGHVSMQAWPYPADTIAKYLIAAVVFYTAAYFILPRTFMSGRYALCAFSLAALCFVSFIPKLFIYHKIFPLLGIPEMPYTNGEFFLMHTWWWFQYTLFAFGFWFLRDSAKKEKALRLAEQKRLYAEQEKLQAEQEKLLLENAHLRAQINPHFLFNTLSYFHNRAMDMDPILADGIVALSGIMRSAIEKTDGDGSVPLEGEIENIEHLIGIYRMRFGSAVSINLDDDGDYRGFNILPHVLVTFVENALKHGELHDPAYPVVIMAGIEDGYFRFRVRNGKRDGPKEISHGIGIRYVRSQLEHAYNGNYALDINETDKNYTVSLSIALVALEKNTMINERNDQVPCN